MPTSRRKISTISRWTLFLISLGSFLAFGLYTMKLNQGSRKLQEVSGYESFNDATVSEAEKMLIQSGGRVKPLISWSKFLVYSLNGASSVKFKHNDKKHKISSTEVVLQCLFRPEFASTLELFRVEDKVILTSLNIPSEILDSKEKRDRYSFSQLTELYPAIKEKANTIFELNSKDWSTEQRQTVNLRNSLVIFEFLTLYFDFARASFPSTSHDKDDAKLSDWLVNLDSLLEAFRIKQSESGELSPELLRFWHRFEELALKSGDFFTVIPSYTTEQNGQWTAFGSELKLCLEKTHQDPQKFIDQVKLAQNITDSVESGDSKKITQAFQIWNTHIADSLTTDVIKRRDSEVTYANRDYFFNALVCLFPALLLVLVSWIVTGKRSSKLLRYGIVALTSISCLFVLIGIVHRCILMQRPPIGNLFDTIIFIAGLSLFILILIELITKRSIAISLGVFLGMTLLFLARRYEIGDGKDHLDPLVAVLDSNYWLATHVVTITLGYMGGLVASGFSATYILGRLFRIAEDESDFRKVLNRTVYGMIGFTLLFSLVGTVLGGIWANDSWGRFWGWDPKENGALMIVLWCLILLHARLAGFLREWGLHICTVIGANVVVFSWWHVNSLSTGLHSYGFIEGINAIWLAYAFTSIVALLGLICKFILSSNKGDFKLKKTVTSL